MDDKPKRLEGLDVDQTDDGYVIYEPDKDRVHHLNPTAALILELCNGTNSVAGIAEALQEAFHLPEPPTRMVEEVLTQMKGEGLLV